MGHARHLGQKAFLKAVVLAALALAPALAPRAAEAATWKASLRERIAALQARYPSRFGVHVEDLGSGETFSVNAEQAWYLASGVKLPVAVETLRQVDQGRLALDRTIRLEEADKLDGAGETNSQAAGTRLSVRYLLEQMLIHSDNTASDLLIRQVGIENVNRWVRSAFPGGFERITSLGDVRRHAFRPLVADSFLLRNIDLLKLRTRYRPDVLSRAYDAYYASGLNSGSLMAYGALLRKIDEGKLLEPASQKFLMDTLFAVRTGRNRIKAGLPPGVRFAHKTGTQRSRFCDFGIAHDANTSRRVAIAACTRGIASEREAEAVLREIGRALAASGVFASCLHGSEGCSQAQPQPPLPSL